MNAVSLRYIVIALNDVFLLVPAKPAHLAVSASCLSALVAVIARRPCTPASTAACADLIVVELSVSQTSGIHGTQGKPVSVLHLVGR